jgi:hypothetical protein
LEGALREGNAYEAASSASARPVSACRLGPDVSAMIGAGLGPPGSPGGFASGQASSSRCAMTARPGSRASGSQTFPTASGGIPRNWAPMLKGVACLFRYRDDSKSANSRYLDGLAVVSDPTVSVREVERITSRKQVTPTRTAKTFNPMSREDLELFRAFLSGDHHLGGFRNRDILDRLAGTAHLKAVGPEQRRRSAKVSRILQRFRAHGLIAKIPHSRKWRTTRFGQRGHGHLNPAP